MDEDIRLLRSRIRAQAKAARIALTPQWRQEADKSICSSVIRLNEYKKAQTVMLYMALDCEASLDMVLKDAQASGKRVVLPACDDLHGNMTARCFEPLSGLCRGCYGIAEPQSTAKTDPLSIDCVLVPVVAFDIKCRRLGHGAGYYDRFLPKLKKDAALIGIAYMDQRFDCIPVLQHDIQLDAVVTEAGIIRRGE